MKGEFHLKYTVQAFLEEEKHTQGVYESLEEAKEEAWKWHYWWLNQDVWPDWLEVVDENNKTEWDWCFD